MSLREFLFLHRHKKACRKLQRLVEKERNSFRCQDFRKRREAALKHSRGPSQADFHAGAA